MSLYGNIKRIGSGTFQFDRIYSTRKEMDNNCATDGVYAGRYVLVEYGDRYAEDAEGYRIERQEYQNNYDDDHNEYGNIYDSTVWQKVYTNYHKGAEDPQTYSEKYIMVAELNALAPKITLVQDETASLIKTESDIDPELTLYYGENNEALHNVKEIKANVPYFDEIQDTELEYILHMPKPLELEVNKDVDYHKDKFDIYHSYITDNSGDNFIGWKPKPEGEEASKIITDGDDKAINEDIQFSKQELNMHLPAFGDVLGALYDTLFGQATQSGGIRPYFYSLGLRETDFNEDGTINPTAFEGPADISRVIANNSEGLAGVLNALFTDNTIPGQVRYYLMSDWLAKNMDNNTNTPGIINKPKVVMANNQISSDYNGQYKIDFTNWTLTNIKV